MRSSGNERFVACSRCLEVGTGELRAAGQRRAPFVRPISASCSASEVRSHVSMRILMRRATRYEPPASQPSFASCSGEGTQTCSSSEIGSSAFRLAVPSLNPNRLRVVICAVEVDEVRPKPSWDHLTVAVPKAMRARLRTACTATCGSSAHACMQRSPPERAGESLSFGKSGSSVNDGGRRAAMPNRSTPSAVSNSVGPKPIVMLRRDADRPNASPVSSGGASGDPSTAPNSPTGTPRVIFAAASVHCCNRRIRRSRLVVVTSNAAKWSRS